ncbi:GntR family transcriptional regulator [Halalkalibacterium halodurans]|nr:GntR family transcriptional regulator [Halalkalibacterium halodurans]
MNELNVKKRPLYKQLKQELIQKIERGELKPGDVLPPERELAKIFNMSRMTVRQAISELVNEYVLIRRHGSGTYVAEHKIPQGKKLKSFSEEMRLRGMLPGSKLCEKKIVLSPSANMAAELKSEGKLFMLKRLRLADLEPMAIETSLLPINRFPSLENRNFENESLYEILEEEYNIKMTKAQQKIEVRMPTPQESELLDINYTIPVFHFKQVTFDQNDTIFEVAHSVYRGDRYEIETEIYR